VAVEQWDGRIYFAVQAGGRYTLRLLP
jgi:hypothetical protein